MQTDQERTTPESGGFERIEKTRKQVRKLAIAAAVVCVLALIGAVCLIRQVLIPMNYYNHGQDCLLTQDYAGAKEWFEKADGYGDSAEQVLFCEAMMEEA